MNVFSFSENQSFAGIYRRVGIETTFVSLDEI